MTTFYYCSVNHQSALHGASQIRELSGRSNLYCRCKALLAALHSFYISPTKSIFNLKKKLMKFVHRQGIKPGSAV